MLKAGQDFSEIQDSYMVFITQTDIFGYEILIYTIKRHFKEEGGRKGMCEAVEKYAEDYAEQVRANSLVESIRTLMGIMKLGAEQVMNLLGANDSDREILQKRL